MPIKDPLVRKQRQRQYYVENKTKWQNLDGSWKKPDADRRRQWARNWYTRNKDRILASRPKTKRPSVAKPLGVCELCGEDQKKLHWDHCHTTGNFRGWICFRCNSTLGLVKDNLQLLQKMIHYLQVAGKMTEEK